MALCFSVLPSYIGGWNTLCICGAGLGIIGSIMVLVSRKPNTPLWVESNKKLFCWAGLLLFVIPLLIWGCITLFHFFDTQKATPYGHQNNTTNVDVKVPVITTEPNGIDVPRNCWQHIKAGTVISGDIAIFDGDNNNHMTIINDGASKTADIVRVNQDMNIWFEYGGYAIPNATEDEIRNLITDKLGEFSEVRYFPNLEKLAGGYWFYSYTVAKDGTVSKSEKTIKWTPVLDNTGIHPTKLTTDTK